MRNLVTVLIICTLLLLLSACSTKNTDLTASDTVKSDPSSEKTMNPEPEEMEFSALELLNCYLGEDGIYRVDQNALCVTDDYELFRKYFFGTWEGIFRFPEYPEQESLVIDDSEKSYIMTETGIRMAGDFYEIDGHVLAFLSGSDCGPAIHWIDIDEPDTMYMVWGGVSDANSLWSREEDGSFTTIPAVYSLTKTDTPPNEPEKNFLSIYRLREISRDYGIDLELLVNIEHESKDGAITLYHDDWYQFYPVYLVSEAPSKLEFKTQVGNVYSKNSEIGVSYTLEKINGEWVRTLEFVDVTT